MEITTTKIANLPSSSSSQPSYTGLSQQPTTIKIEKEKRLGEVDTIYQNLNVHPNPYIPEGGYAMDFEAPVQQQQQYPLASRDIPMNTNQYSHDEQIKANYIPPLPPTIDDYINDTQYITNNRIKKHQQKQKRKRDLMDIISDSQFVIYLSLLFLLFNLPIVNRLLFNVISRFGWFYYADGNLNFYGLVLKSIIFGLTYLVIQKGVDYIVV